MLRTSYDGLAFYRFQNLAAYPHVIQAVFSRCARVARVAGDSLGDGVAIGDDRAGVGINRGLICRSLGSLSCGLVTARQIHGSRVAVASDDDAGKVLPDTDSIVTDTPGLALLLRFADCVPVMLYDPTHRAIGLAHAGWRGTARGIVARTLGRMIEEYGTKPADIVAGIGPSIGPCCYQVGRDVAHEVETSCAGRRAVARYLPDGSVHLDLWEANRVQLLSMGVDKIELAALCTSCRVNEFFSYRVEGEAAGRFPALLGLSKDGGGASEDHNRG